MCGASCHRLGGAGRGRGDRVAVDDGDVERSWWLGGAGAEGDEEEEGEQ